MVVNNIVGKYVDLRSATVEDAEFALNIRRTPKAVKFMPPLDITLEQQKSWIEKQRTTEGDYFFIVFNKNDERVGVLGVYDIHIVLSPKHGEVGRIVMQGKSFESLEAYLLLLRFAFKTLKLEKVTAYTYPNNFRAVRFYEFFGARLEETPPDVIKNYSCVAMVHTAENFGRCEQNVMNKIFGN